MPEISFVSTGDPKKDEEIRRRFELHDERIGKGICPNGCGPMVLSGAHNQDCPACGFHQWSNVPIVREVAH